MVKIECNLIEQPAGKPKIQELVLTAQRDSDKPALDTLMFTMRKLLQMAGSKANGGYKDSLTGVIAFHSIIPEEPIDG